MNKEKRLEELAEEIAHCKECQRDSLGKPVPGEGSPHAEVMFVGEAPGKQEAEIGRPFIGRSGKLLHQHISAVGLSEDDVFITSVCKYLPVSGTPTPRQIIHGMTHLQKQIDVINPKIIVLLGSVACKGVLQMPIFVAKEHGSVMVKDGRKCFVSYHPAAAVRFRKNLVFFERDFQSLKELLTAL